MRTLLCWGGCVVSAISADAAVEQEKVKAELVRTEAEFFRHAFEHGCGAGLFAYMADDSFIANTLILER